MGMNVSQVFITKPHVMLMTSTQLFLCGHQFFIYKEKTMLKSIAFILIIGIIVGSIFEKMKLPRLMGMLITGIIIGPHVLGLLDDVLLNISSEIRSIALVIILTRAGLSLNLEDLKKVGRPAILMCFVPACLEIFGFALLGPIIFNIDLKESLVLGSVLAAVSPAVIVPKMLKLMDEQYGTKQSIPQMILAGASVDDVFVIVLFTAFCGLIQNGTLNLTSFIQIPESIILGILIGALVGIVLSKLFQIFKMKEMTYWLFMLSTMLLLTAIENMLKPVIYMSGLLAVMSCGIFFKRRSPQLAKQLQAKFNTVWQGAEVFLFVLVGASVNIEYAFNAGPKVILIIFGALIFRLVGVMLCVMKTSLTVKERLFCVIGYMPKATVQAAIGGVPLALGFACGELVLTTAVIAILITAPIGAFLIDLTYKNFLEKAV